MRFDRFSTPKLLQLLDAKRQLALVAKTPQWRSRAFAQCVAICDELRRRGVPVPE